MARRIPCAGYVSLLATLLLSDRGVAQNTYPSAMAPYESQRRQEEQLWYGAQGAYGAPPPSPGAATPFAPPPIPSTASPGYNPNVTPSGGFYGPVNMASPPPVPASGVGNFGSYPAGTPSYNTGFMPPVVQPQGMLAPPAYQYGMPQVAALPNNAPAPGWDGAFPSAAPAPSPGGPEVIGMPTFGSQTGLTAPPAWTPPPQGAAAPTQAELFEQAKVVAVIGDERILLGDIVGLVNQFLEANKSKIPPGREDYYRERITQQVLESEVQSKLVYLDFLRKIRSKGAGEDKITEIHNRVYTQFDEKRLLDMMQKANVSSPVELDAKLREQGSSLMKHKRQFAQKVMSQQWLRENEQVNFDPIITHAQMLDYYYAHEEDYAIQATAKWEHLMARFDKFPDKATAYEAIRAMGNEVYLGGAPLWAVAKRASHGVTASDGGQYESTTKGSLRSKVLDQAIFELPLRQLSPILEDEEGFHIVRVLERQDASRKSFESTQSEIKEAIRKEMVQKQIDAYMDELKKKTPVWTIFDEKNKQAAEEQARRNSEFGP